MHVAVGTDSTWVLTQPSIDAFTEEGRRGQRIGEESRDQRRGERRVNGEHLSYPPNLDI